MENCIFSNHAISQMDRRGISMEIVLEVLKNPEEIITMEEQIVHQSIVNFTDGNKDFLVRIFINAVKTPKVVITVYRTSKIKKYYES